MNEYVVKSVCGEARHVEDSKTPQLTHFTAWLRKSFNTGQRADSSEKKLNFPQTIQLLLPLPSKKDL